MELPTQNDFAFYLLQQLYYRDLERSGNGLTTEEAYEILSNYLGLNQEQINLMLNSENRPVWKNKIRRAKQQLQDSLGFISSPEEGYWIITERGRNYFEQMVFREKTTLSKQSVSLHIIENP